MKNELFGSGGTYTILDGAMGTELMKGGMPLGQRPELLCFTDPELVKSVHRAYIGAGSQIIYANTFCANGHKLRGTGRSAAETVSRAVRLAKEAAEGTGVRAALDMGPIGELMEPLGTLSFREAYDLFREMVEAGAGAGADLIAIETMTDLGEVRAALLAAKENADLPTLVTMTFEAGGRTFTGCTPAAMALTLEGLGADAIGVNCSLGPRDLLPMVEEMARWTSLPLAAKPNAGLPDPVTGAYTITPEEFAREMAAFARMGVTILGGCCGTSPAFIRALRQELETLSPGERPPRTCHGVCCAGRAVDLSGVRVIGERINPTGKKRFQQALREGDLNYILTQAMEQQEAGADILDVNVGLPGIDEGAMMEQTVAALQAIVPLPLQIDSSDPRAIEAGLRRYGGKAIVNSVNGKEEVLRAVLPIVKKYGAAVVGLTMDEKGIPQTAEERVAIARRILEAALSYGIPREDVYIDCLTLTVSAQQSQARETLKALRAVREELGLHTVLGVSNISFGLPERLRITENFLIQALCCGLDLPIVNPNQRQIMDAIASYKVLSGEDRDAEGYVARFAARGEQGGGPAPVSAPAGTMDLPTALGKGLKEECARLTRALLEEKEELEIINGILIPALDQVGLRYERKELFLPQLINAANAACAAFDVLKESIAQKGGGSVLRGRILLATVEGDIHDIGKNIVKVILENYGYQVLDLGRDVPPQQVARRAREENIPLVGLSALMTTTVESMAKTIRAIRESGHPCKIMVGGAVLTPEYAKEIGADFYARDARESAQIARRVLG